MKQRYTKEYKLEALKLADQLGSMAEAARQLGLTENAIYNWKNKFGFKTQKDADKQMNTTPETDEIKHLKKKVEELKKVNYILKRAAAFFSQDHLI